MSQISGFNSTCNGKYFWLQCGEDPNYPRLCMQVNKQNYLYKDRTYEFNAALSCDSINYLTKLEELLYTREYTRNLG